jgi:hypothetical protein
VGRLKLEVLACGDALVLVPPRREVILDLLVVRAPVPGVIMVRSH